MVYQYHIKLLKHFTRTNPLNLPFYLLRSLGKMSDRVQSKSKQVDTSVFHSGLIKMLVLEELKKTNIDRDVFLVASRFQPDVVNTPQTKRNTPTSLKNIVHIESSKRRKMVKNDNSSQSTDKIGEGPSQPLHEETSPMEKCSPMETSSSKERNLKGNKYFFSPLVAAESVMPKIPFTRSTTRQHISVEEGASKAPTQKIVKTKPLKEPT